VRSASGLGDNLIGVKLMHEAFAPEGGSLTDMNAVGGERVGRMELLPARSLLTRIRTPTGT
jgi:hypothetical protein